MHRYTLSCELLTHSPLKETFKIFEDPHNLAQITPPWVGFEVTTDRIVMRAGAEIDYRIRWMGLPMRWKTLITEYEPPFLFVDEQKKGPYAVWRHRHTFAATVEGTRVSDHVEYALPFGPLGQLAHSVVVGKQLKEIFEYRQNALAKLFEEDSIVSKTPVIVG